jgi:general secretion pathway protein H
MRPTSRTGTDGGTTSRGFTLVELLVALAIVTLLAAMLSPMLLPSPGRTLNAAAGELVVTLREARRQAQATQARQRVVVDTEARRYGIASTGQWRDLPEGGSAELTTARSLLSDDETRGAIEFFPDGSSSGGRVVLGLDGHATQIDIAWLTGQVRLSAVDP